MIGICRSTELSDVINVCTSLPGTGICITFSPYLYGGALDRKQRPVTEVMAAARVLHGRASLASDR